MKETLLKFLGRGGAITIILLFVIFIFLIGPFIMILGLDLMGFEVNYTIKSFLGSALIIIAIRGGSGIKS